MAELDALSLTYFGHLLREDGTFTRQVCFLGSTATHNLHARQRVGGERLSWLSNTTARYWHAVIPKALRHETRATDFRNTTYDPASQAHTAYILHCAQSRFA